MNREVSSFVDKYVKEMSLFKISVAMYNRE